MSEPTTQEQLLEAYLEACQSRKDLLTALQTILKWEVPTYKRADGTEEFYGSNDQRDYMREIARTAIAKATGHL